jgi:hypothetical protein
MLGFDDPMTRAKRARSKRQQQAFFNLTIGLVLGGSMSFLVMELIKGVSV